MLKPNNDYLCLQTDRVSWVQVGWLMGDKGPKKLFMQENVGVASLLLWPSMDQIGCGANGD